MFVRRRDAEHYLKIGRAEYLGRDQSGTDQLRLVDAHPANQPRVVPGYDDIKAGFKWRTGTSAGAAVMKAERGAERFSARRKRQSIQLLKGY